VAEREQALGTLQMRDRIARLAREQKIEALQIGRGIRRSGR
jgi:hypothetical protein